MSKRRHYVINRLRHNTNLPAIDTTNQLTNHGPSAVSYWVRSSVAEQLSVFPRGMEQWTCSTDWHLVGWIQIRTQALCLSFPKQLPRLRDTEFWNDQLVQQRIWIGLDKEHDAKRTQIAVYPQEKLCNWIPSFPLKLNTSKITDSFQFCVFKFC